MYLLIGLLVLVVVVWVAKYVIDSCNFPEPVRSIALLIVGLVALLALLGGGGFHMGWW